MRRTLTRALTWTVIAALAFMQVPVETLWRLRHAVRWPAAGSECAAGEVIRKK